MEAELKILKLLKDNFPIFAQECLFIKTKDARQVPLIFNEAQLYLHNRIEAHKKRTGGRVRIVVLKARQFGISTYVEARFIHRTLFNRSTNAFIMADSRNSANNIFDMTKRYYDNLPIHVSKPPLKKSNEKSLVFDGIDSSFRIGTAGAATTGRSMTNQLLHGSEIGFWENADDIITGLFQTVPDNPQSEIILESTANGLGGFFYDKVHDGLNPDSEWETVFLPWFWHKEYSTIPPEGFELTHDEYDLKKIYSLTDAQLYWRRRKTNSEFSGKAYLFAQEYPASIEEAFLSSQNGLIMGRDIERAKKCTDTDNYAPVVMAVDPARSGDRTVIAIRKGREVIKIIKYEDMESQQLAGILKVEIKKYGVVKCFIDVGCGYGTIDRLRADGYKDIVLGIPFNSGATNIDRYTNKRSEIFGDMRDWFMQDGWVNIPDDDEIATEIGILPDMKRNANEQWYMIPKDEIKKMNGGRSTDIADALALTFAAQISINAKKTIKRKKTGKSINDY